MAMGAVEIFQTNISTEIKFAGMYRNTHKLHR